MPTSLQDLEEQQKLIRQKGAKATQLAGVGSQFMANVKEELRKRAQDKGVTQLGQQAAAARKEFAEAPARIREEYQGIDPYRQMSAVAERKGSILAELTEIADLKAQRQASVTDILEGMKGGIEAEAEQARYGAELEQQLYQNMFGQYQLELENTWKQKQFDQAAEQMAITQSYNNAVLALQQGDAELANQQFEEAKRHELVAEQLAQDNLELERELGWGQINKPSAGGGGGFNPFDPANWPTPIPTPAQPLTPTPVPGKTYSLTPLLAPNGDIIGADDEEEHRYLIGQGYKPYFGR